MVNECGTSPWGIPIKTHHVHTLHSTLKGCVTSASLSGDCTNVNRSGALLCSGTLNLIQNDSKGQGPGPRLRLPPRKSSSAPSAPLHWFQIKEHLNLSLHWMFYCCCRFINWQFKCNAWKASPEMWFANVIMPNRLSPRSTLWYTRRKPQPADSKSPAASC